MANLSAMKIFLLCSFIGMAVGETLFFDAASGVIAPRADLTNCTGFGPVCTNCETLSFCFETGDGNYVSSVIATCKAPETCNKDTLSCSTEPNGDCYVASSTTNFVCFEVGIFPDPLSCLRYHMCVPKDATKNTYTPEPKPVLITCPKGFGFDPITSTCSLNLSLTGGKCNSTLAPPCTNGTGRGVIKQNPSLYYVCMKVPPVANAPANTPDVYYPQLFRCPKDQQYLNNLKCDSLPVAPVAPAQCTERNRYYDPKDCRAYYDCALGRAAIRVLCPLNTRFVYQEQACVAFSCAPSLTNAGVCKL